MKYLPWIIIAVLLLLLAIGILTRPEPTDSNGYVKEYEAQIQKRDEQLGLKDAQIQTLLNERQKKDSTHAVERGVFKSALKSKSQEVDRLKKSPIVIKVREENPAIDTLILELESKIDFQSQYITTLDSAYNDLRGDFEKVKDNFTEQIKLLQANYKDQVAISSEDRKQLRKTRRQVKVLKVVAIMGTVGGIFLGSR